MQAQHSILFGACCCALLGCNSNTAPIAPTSSSEGESNVIWEEQFPSQNPGQSDNGNTSTCTDGEIMSEGSFYYECYQNNWYTTSAPVQNVQNNISQSTSQSTPNTSQSSSNPTQPTQSTPSSPCAPTELYVKAIDEGYDKCYKTATIAGKTWMTEDLVVFSNLESYTRMSWIWAMNINPGDAPTTFIGEDETRQGRCPSGWHIPSLKEWQALLSNANFNVSSMNMGICGVPRAPLWWTSTKTRSSPYYCNPCEQAEYACQSYTFDSVYEFHIRCVKN